jgi:hypothetical protein
LAGTLLFDEKIRQSVALFWFGLRDIGILYLLVQAAIQRTMDVSLALLEHSSADHMQTGIQTSRRLDSFLHEAAENFELLSNIQDQISKIKNLKRLMSPIQWCHSHADQIWLDATL